MATEKKQEKLMWDSADFAAMYASAEKLTGHFAELLVKRANLDKATGDDDLVVLDEACGTGVVSFHLMNVLDEKAKAKLDLTCSDFARAMVDFVRKRLEDGGWQNARAIHSDATDTKLPSAHYTHVLLNFGPMIFPDWKAGLREIHRMLRPGGTVAMSSWLEVGWFPDIRAAFETDPEIPTLPAHEDLRKAFSPDGMWDDPVWIRNVVEQHGFLDVNVHEVPHTSVLNSFDEFSRLMVGTVGMILASSWTADQQEKYKERAHQAVVKYMKDKYGDGEIKWDWIAILTTAKKAA